MNIKNKVLKEIEIENIAAEGKCMAHHEGKVIFITDVAPEDVSDIRIKRKKKAFSEAVPIKIHQSSKLKQEPFCDHFGTFGGCKWQHIDYNTQLVYKQQQVVDNFERIAKIEVPEVSSMLASEQTQHYRNKLEFTF